MYRREEGGSRLREGKKGFVERRIRYKETLYVYANGGGPSIKCAQKGGGGKLVRKEREVDEEATFQERGDCECSKVIWGRRRVWGRTTKDRLKHRGEPWKDNLERGGGRPKISKLY